MAIIILLHGWSGAGKDMVGQILCTNYGFQRLAFADELKRMICEEYGFPITWTQTQEGKRRVVDSAGMTVRQLMIKRGQEIRAERNDPGLFARGVANQILEKISSEPSSRFVITDWRLPCEFSILEQIFAPHCCKLLKVFVQNAKQTESPVQDTVTENQLQKYIFDARIDNDGHSLQTLQAEVERKLYDHIFVSEV
jgi:hypothetical protein